MRTYGQYCPIARGAEIFAERWTPLITRNLYLGSGSFSAILEGAPGLSRTLLSQRLQQLEQLGVVKSAPKADGRGHHYELTSAGHDLFKVCQSLGEWSARWLEIAPENLSIGARRRPTPCPVSESWSRRASAHPRDPKSPCALPPDAHVVPSRMTDE